MIKMKTILAAVLLCISATLHAQQMYLHITMSNGQVNDFCEGEIEEMTMDNTDEPPYELKADPMATFFHLKLTNGNDMEYNMKRVKDITFNTTPPMLNGHEYVDIGGIKWATMNVGATTVAKSKDTAFGNYYAWGETEPKTYYDEDNYTYTSNDSKLSNDHDVAYQEWGEGWMMPSSVDFQSLVNACWGEGNVEDEKDDRLIKLMTVTESMKDNITNGDYGIYKVEAGSIIDGETYGVAGILFVRDAFHKLFFPAAGVMLGDVNVNDELEGTDYVEYWCNDIYAGDKECAYNFSCDYEYIRFQERNKASSVYVGGWSTDFRFIGFTVRPIVKYY